MDVKQAKALADAYVDRAAAGGLTPSEDAAARVILREFMREHGTLAPPVLGTTTKGEVVTLVRDTNGQLVASIKEPMTIARVHE